MKGKIFNAQEVQAILSGSKVMFREVIKPQPIGDQTTLVECPNNKFRWVKFGDKVNIASDLFNFPYQVGQKIFCKEKWGIGRRPDQFGGYTGFEYAADSFNENENLPCYEIDYDKLPKNIDIDNWCGNWQQARLMLQWASRLTLRITEIKVEKLQDISYEDAIAEGVTSRPNCSGYGDRYEGYSMDWSRVGKPSKWSSSGTLREVDICLGNPQMAFANFWNATHKKPEEKFEANPWVWKIEFKII